MRREARELYPAWPDKAEALRRWLDERGLPLAAKLRPLRDALRELRLQAAPYTEADAAKDRESHPRAAVQSLALSLPLSLIYLAFWPAWAMFG